MSKKRTKTGQQQNGLRREYDLSKLKGGVRGKYAPSYAAGTNVALLAPDVVEHFPTDRAVNSALRRLIRSGKTQTRRSR